jgi:methylated-DNA-protein-cysteine methyltransferase-like protein
MDDLNLSPAERDTVYAMVWEIARQVPSGQVTTYGQIAAFIPCPDSIPPEAYLVYRARWAGSAMAACPGDVPWQRVINAQGKISPRRGAEMQRTLLENEGVVFDQRDRVDLARFGWRGPADEWLRSHNLIAPDGQLSLF